MYSTLALVSRDGMSSTIQTTEMVVMEKMRKLNDVGRQQVHVYACTHMYVHVRTYIYVSTYIRIDGYCMCIHTILCMKV